MRPIEKFRDELMNLVAKYRDLGVSADEIGAELEMESDLLREEEDD